MRHYYVIIIYIIFLLTSCTTINKIIYADNNNINKIKVIKIPIVIHLSKKTDRTILNEQILFANEHLSKNYIILSPIFYIYEPNLPQIIRYDFTKLKVLQKNIASTYNIYVVNKLLDQKTKQPYNGVQRTWFGLCQSYIVLSSSEYRTDTLLHELGHEFGLEHNKSLTNVMSTNRKKFTKLNAKQYITLKKNIKVWLNTCVN